MGMKQRDFARRISISPSYLSEIENGKREPSVLVLRSIEMEFSISPDWLLHGEGPEFTKLKTWTEMEGAEEKVSWRAAEEKDPPHIISMKEGPELYRLIDEIRGLSQKEKKTFFGIAFAYLEGIKKK